MEILTEHVNMTYQIESNNNDLEDHKEFMSCMLQGWPLGCICLKPRKYLIIYKQLFDWCAT